MKRFVIVVGNGLGTAIDSEHFSLSKGLETVWLDTSSFSQNQKNLVISAMPKLAKKNYPSSEEELDNLQFAIVATEWLKSFESAEVTWLDEHSKELPQAFRRFVHEVGFYFHNSGEELREAFVSGLAQFIKDTKSHVATLNYDNLLYDALVNYQVVRGYDGSLIDGFWETTGFKKQNLDRHSPSMLGWYLHLHGSPLFIGNKKLTREIDKIEVSRRSRILF